MYLQNESKLEQVQLQFPNDALDMFEVSWLYMYMYIYVLIPVHTYSVLLYMYM